MKVDCSRNQNQIESSHKLVFDDQIRQSMHVLSKKDYTGQRIRDGSGRNTPKVTGTWKQYSARKISGVFRSLSCVLRQEPVGNHRKKFRKFSGWNTASMFR